MNEIFDAAFFESLGNVKRILSETTPGVGGPSINNTYNLHELYIQIKDGRKISLVETLSTMVIYEDVFSNALNGYIEVNDAAGGLEKFYITGGETIGMKVLKPLPSSEIIISRSDFIVHEISKIEVNDLNTLKYRLFFVSKAGIMDKKKRVYKAFTKEKKISEIVTKLFTQVDSPSNIALNIDNEDTKVKLEKSFLCPGLTPFEAIDFLVKRTCYSGDYYMFFERVHKFREKTHVFAGMNHLRGYWPSIDYVPNLIYQPQMSYVTSSDPKTIKAISIQIQDNYRHVGNMLMGFYNSRLRMVDPLTRRFTDAKLNYKDIQNANKANKFLTDDNIFMNYDDSYPEYPGERLMVRPRHDVIANKNQWVRNEVYYSVFMSTIRVNVDISGGDNLISAGNVVKLTMPSIDAKTNEYSASIVQPDAIYSGEYFVTAVRHTFTLAGYSKKLELSKDSGRLNLENLLSNVSNTPPPTNVEFLDTSRNSPVVPSTPATFPVPNGSEPGPVIATNPAQRPASGVQPGIRERNIPRLNILNRFTNRKYLEP